MPNNLNAGKKITLLLVDGEPNGQKIINLGGWNGLAIVFPRNKLKEVEADQSVKKPGVYFLFGKSSEDGPTTSFYIGHANNIFERLSTHNHDRTKEFWFTTIIFVGNDDSFDSAHAKYLESRCLELAREVNHFGYTLENGNEPQPATLPRADIPVMEEFLSNINLLLATIGHPLLEKIEPKQTEDTNNPLFFGQSNDAKGKAVAKMTNDGLVVYKDSTITAKHSSAVVERNTKIIEKLLAEGILSKKDDLYVFKKDYIFTKPSAAASLVTGYSINGWVFWKNKDGKTLDEVYRTA